MRALLLAAAVLLAPAPAAQAAFPGRNGRLVFTVDRSTAGGQGETTLETVGPRGLGRRVLSLCGDDEWGPCDDGWGPYLPSPRYSPDGRALAFGTELRPYDPFRPQETGFGLIGADGSAFEYQHGDPVPSLAWAPDGWHLLVETLGGLWRVRADGKQPVLVIDHGRNPDWAAGGRIVYELKDDLYIRERSGATRRLTYRGGAKPSWSPGGRWVAFERNDDVYLVKRGRDGVRGAKRAGTRLRRLTRAGGSTPAWSPDGRRIAFVRGGSLFTIGRRGRGLRRLVAGAPGRGTVADVDWQPRP
jgi:Tol biopolymer transport system component